MTAAYLGDGPRDDPRCSTVFADLRGLPPLLVQVGENEILYDDATRIRDPPVPRGRRDLRVVETRIPRLPVFVRWDCPSPRPPSNASPPFLKGRQSWRRCAEQLCPDP